MKTCKIDGSKVVFDINGRTQHFTLDAGSEIVYFAMHHFTHEEIVDSFGSNEATSKLLRYLPGYKPTLIENKEEKLCPHCHKPI